MKKLVEEIKKRFETSIGCVFAFRDDVEVITLEDLEFALSRLEKEGKITYHE